MIMPIYSSHANMPQAQTLLECQIDAIDQQVEEGTEYEYNIYFISDSREKGKKPE